MMKYGKSISVEELFEPVLCALRCRWRLKQALLLLSLQTGQVAYWQNGEHSWQEQLDEECLTNKQRLADTLREMRRRELQAVLKWEIQQSVPWPEEDYTYSFEATEFSEAGEQQYQVTFTALQDTSRAELEHLCSSLLLKLQGILLSDMTFDEAAEKWFTGKQLPTVYRQKQKYLHGAAAAFGRWLPKVSGAALALALLAYGGAWGGCYLAQRDLREVEQRLAQYAEWEQRMQESKAVEHRCQRLEKLLATASKPSKEAVGELERICRQMIPGCWLTLLEYNGSKKPLVLQGQAVDNLALESFVEQLQKCGNYSRVELLQSQQQGNVLVYKLQLQMKEGKQ